MSVSRPDQEQGGPAPGSWQERTLDDMTLEETLFGFAPRALLNRPSYTRFGQIWTGEVSCGALLFFGPCGG